MEFLTSIGLAAPAGLNAYVPILAVALAVRFDLLELSAPYDLLGEWWVIGIAAVLFVVEVLADKIPAVDSVNDVVQTVLRPAAGGLLFVSTSQAALDVHPALLVAVGVVLAGGVHAAKATARPMVNAGTGGLAAPVVSTAEDVFAAVMSLMAILVPVSVGILLLLLIVGVWRLRRRRTAAV
jgi:hypothetical protein